MIVFIHAFRLELYKMICFRISFRLFIEFLLGLEGTVFPESGAVTF